MDGDRSIPNLGNKTPIAKGIAIKLYPKAQNRFCLILLIAFLARSNAKWRPINLTKDPFNLPKPYKLLNDKDNNEFDKFKSFAIWKIKDL